MVAPLLIMFPFAFRAGWRKDRFLIFLGIVIGFECFFTIYAKGDWMPGARFLIPVQPLLVLTGIYGFVHVMEKLFDKGMGMPSANVLAGSAIFVGLVFAMAGRTALRGEAGEITSGFASLKGHSLTDHEAVGSWLRGHVGDHATVALSEAGIISTMIPDTKIIDLNGLMNSRIARERRANTAFNVHYVLDLKPDYIVLHTGQVSPLLTSLANNPIFALDRDSLFHSTYRLVQQFPNFEIYSRNQ